MALALALGWGLGFGFGLGWVGLVWIGVWVELVWFGLVWGGWLVGWYFLYYFLSHVLILIDLFYQCLSCGKGKAVLHVSYFLICLIFIVRPSWLDNIRNQCKQLCTCICILKKFSCFFPSFSSDCFSYSLHYDILFQWHV